MLCGWTMGRPYSTHIMQLRRVAMYGIGENCSTDPFFHILQKVGLFKKKEKNNKSMNKLIWLVCFSLMTSSS
jgi:hypothetical protein